MEVLTALSIAEEAVMEAVKLEPLVAAGLQKIFASGNPTREQFAALRSEIIAKTYFDFVPTSQLPH